jgi:general secretion pathway protein E
LLTALDARRWLTAAQQRDIVARAPQVRARLVRQRQVAEPGAPDAVSAVELVAAFGLQAADGHLLDEDRLTQLVADVAQLPYLKIDPLTLDMGLVTQTVSRPFATRHGVLPLRRVGETLQVAVVNPFDTQMLDSLAAICKGPIVAQVASRHDIRKCIDEIYGFRRSVESAAAQSLPEPGHELEQLMHLPEHGEVQATDQHVVHAVNYLFAYAYDQRASDIHIEPRRTLTQVRLRIDGVLHGVHTVPRRVHAAVVSRIKALARLDVAERRRPQDGRIRTRLGARTLEMRVATLPCALGEKVVLRLFDPQMVLQHVEALGFCATELLIYRRWMQAPHGLVLLTGPTGSGKTTTLYATLRALADTGVNVTTVEDPIEMLCEPFNQVAVNPKIGLDFPQALRTLLRQDPDVIMVGEIRDSATAHMAVQAALTGHLVFSTLHTHDSFSAVTRLQQLGVAPFLLAAVLRGVMAQRLLRRLCPNCTRPDLEGTARLAGLAWPGAPAAPRAQACLGRGCVACRHTGYQGREGLFELLDVTPQLAQAVAAQRPESELVALAQAGGRHSLQAGAWDKMTQGKTSVQEYVRVMGLTGG